MSDSSSSSGDSEIVVDEIEYTGELSDTGSYHKDLTKITDEVADISIKDESKQSPSSCPELRDSSPPEVIESFESPSEVNESLESPREAIENPESLNNTSIKKELDRIVQSFKEKEDLPDLVAELIMAKKMNRMIVDLRDYDKGYKISFCKFGDEEEVCHGRYPYAVSVIEYIRDGQIPYEVFDKLCEYDFQIVYDGFMACQLRIHFGRKDGMRSHFVLLRHTIQTIDGECSMRCKNDPSLDYNTEKSRLICHYSPDLCLDPDPIVAEIVISNELNQHPFISPSLKHIILTEKALREKGVIEMGKASVKKSESASKKPKGDDVIKEESESDDDDIEEEPKSDEDWNFRLREPTEEEAELAKLESNVQQKFSMESYLKERKICFPDKYTGFHVEIENFEFEFEYLSTNGTESIQNKLCISVLNDKEFFYGTLRFDVRKSDDAPYVWVDIGATREDLDIWVNAMTKNELGLCGPMRITHNRLFDEQIQTSDGFRIISQKLESPASRVVFPPPSSN